jgi:hypothetical protein
MAQLINTIGLLSLKLKFNFYPINMEFFDFDASQEAQLQTEIHNGAQFMLMDRQVRYDTILSGLS